MSSADESTWTLYDYAIAYRELGMRVIPTEPESKKPAVRRVKEWESKEPSKKQLRRWFRDKPTNGICCYVGEPSGSLVCRDFDDSDAYHEWKCNHPEVAKTLPTAKTGRGYHVWFYASVDDVCELHPTGRNVVHYEDGELRAGQQCMLPPSRHPDGGVYKWVNSPFGNGFPSVDDIVLAGLGRPSMGTLNPVEIGHPGDGGQTCTQEHAGILKEGGMGLGVALGTVRGAIEGSLPSGPGQRWRCIFRLARMLKALPQFADEDDADALRDVVREWHRLAKPVIRTKDWLTNMGEFRKAWKAVKYPYGSYIMTEVAALALREGCPPEVSDDCDGEPSGHAAGICRELARRSADGRFFIDCRTMARHIEVDSHATAATILNELRRVGLIRRISQGQRRTRQASVYQYLGDMSQRAIAC